jgi:hypothetical protein
VDDPTARLAHLRALYAYTVPPPDDTIWAHLHEVLTLADWLRRERDSYHEAARRAYAHLAVALGPDRDETPGPSAR